jgi:hypothetical protein
LPYPFINEELLRHRIGSQNVDRIFDDDNDGAADNSDAAGDDSNPVESICRDASARVATAIRSSRRYSLEKVKDDTCSEVVRLTLDVAHVYAIQRHPEILRIEWQPMWEVVAKELDQLVKGTMLLDMDELPTPAPQATGGAPVMASDCSRGW